MPITNCFIPKHSRYKLFFVFSVLFFINLTLDAQNFDIIDAFEKYHSAPREVAYVHLNKSVYVEGEMLGFKAYVFDKSAKKLSLNTSNLYCTISNDEGVVIKKKLLHVQNGVAHNVFNIDSTFTSGTYTFKAYTNWMRNFNEANHYQQTFKVFDADNNDKIKKINTTSLDVDLQVLGEGGHILRGVANTIGIVAKNELGYGVAKASGRIKDDQGNIVSSFQLNTLGLAKTIFTPLVKRKYSVELDFDGNIITKPIKDIKSVGLSLQLTESNNRVLLEFKTNEVSKPILNDKHFKLALHNDSEIKILDFNLESKTSVVLAYPVEELYSGINIFTVFDENNKPVLERLYFNHNGIEREQMVNSEMEFEGDSIRVSLRLPKNSAKVMSSFSVSILPEETLSYNHHNTILSQTYIQPYVNGIIEKGDTYFSSVNRVAKYNLDLLMITQGWSSYDWNTIFNYDDVFKYPFERGIDVVANVNGKKGKGNYVVYPLKNSNTQLFELSSSDKSFTAKSLIPNKDDLLRIGFLGTEKESFNQKPSLYLQFYPSGFADYNLDYPNIYEEDLRNDNLVTVPDDLAAWDKTELLDEVVITTDVTESRAEKLANKAVASRVDIIEDHENRPGMRVDIYLERLGFTTQFDYFSGTLSIFNPRVKWGNPVPLVYLDGALLTTGSKDTDFSILTFITMDIVDYIEYELYGMGGGIRGQAGFIKIYTKPNSTPSTRAQNVVTYDVPLRFNTPKRFYTSKYQFYNTSFFRNYGTIDWKPNLVSNESGEIIFNIPNTQTDTVKLFIEGMLSDDVYISEKIILNIED